MNRRIVLTFLSVVVALVTGSSVASAAPPPFPFNLDFGSLGAPLQHGCSTDLYKPGDWRMGAKDLATAAPVGPQVVGYDRLGGEKDADTFLQNWWNPAKDTWKWPDEDGFVIRHGKPVKREVVMRVGARMDRYGGNSGAFFAPVGTSYTARALPPGNLANVESCNYHIYEVLKPFKVYRGPIAKWFGQRGGGTQFEVTSTLLDPNPECGTTINVQWLLCGNLIKSVYP